MQKNGKARSTLYAFILAAVAGSLLSFSTVSVAYESQCIEVKTETCVTCHPGDSPGKCNLANAHPGGVDCLACHVDCGSGPEHIDNCLGCHVLDDMHARPGHYDCSQCHDTDPPEADVKSDKCIACHPLGDPGKCNLVNAHPGCADCHLGCAGGQEHIDDCLGCHGAPKLHDNHDTGDYSFCHNCHQQKRVLIAYDSKHGSTKSYMNKVAEVLCENNYQVDVDRAGNLLDANVGSYDGVVLGSPCFWGRFLPDIPRFIEGHRSELAGKPVAYAFNGLYGAQTGNAYPKAFWIFHHRSYLHDFHDILPLDPWICGDPCPDCNGGYAPPYPYCDSVPYWVGLMPGRQVPRTLYPVEYIHLEISGLGGVKDYFREEAAMEFAQSLVNYGFFEGASTIPPTVAASASPIAGPEPLTVTFGAEASDPDGTVVAYYWTFGDRENSDQQNPEHTYQCDGTYSAVIEVRDDSGATASDAVEITVDNDPAVPLSFNCDVLPNFEKHCTDCHGNSGGLNLRSCELLQEGGDSGPAVIPGDSANSRLIQTIQYPYTHYVGAFVIDEEDITAIAAWIDSLDPGCAPDEICTCPQP